MENAMVVTERPRSLCPSSDTKHLHEVLRQPPVLEGYPLFRLQSFVIVSQSFPKPAKYEVKRERQTDL